LRFNKRIINNTKFISLTFYRSKHEYILALGWSLIKGDWWYRGSPKNRKFFTIGKDVFDEHTHYGIYIGRLGIVFMN
jgi:hypothetical protein